MLLHRHSAWLAPLFLLVCVALLFLGAPTDGAFEWSDAPRHALNGVFIKDLVAAAPFKDPAGYAYRYYAQYPALTILFYPPLFYVISAPFYALFGVSHQTAVLVVALHYVAFAWGAWRLFRFWMAPWPAGLAALLLACAPEIAAWGRQVMLEIPAFAFLIWSAVFFMRYRREARPALLAACAALLVLALYTKISTAFIALAYAGTLLYERRATLLRERHLWLTVALSLLALAPLVILTVKFGQTNVQSVSGIPDGLVSRRTLAGWLWYLKQIPDQLGLLCAAAAAAAVALALIGRRAAGLARGDVVFLALWFGCGYLFFSAIDLKEARHSIFILPPLVLAAALLAVRAVPGRAGVAVLAVMAAATAAQTVWLRPVRYVEGYAQAAAYIAQHAPKGSAVMFSGYRDGSFTFNMRSREDRRDLTVLRADKLLLKVAVRRDLGVEQKMRSAADIGAELNRLGVHYVVAQPGFWTDLPVMREFEKALASPQFERVARIPTAANYPAHEKELVIYKNLGPVSGQAGSMPLELPMIGKTLPPAK